MELCLLSLISMTVIGAHCDGHSLRYYYTAVSDKGLDIPEFSIVGYVDGREFMNYNSESHQARPVTQWMEKNEGPEYWERQTQVSKGSEPVFRHNVRTAMSRFNQTGGIHSFQYMYGCELRDDGSTAGYMQDGYDGREFMALDTKNWLYIPTMNEAQLSTQRWNSPEVRQGERNKNYLQNECIPWLKKYVEYGREDLEKRVRPEVKVWGRRQSDGATRLQCLVYGFHPRAVDVRWMKNEADHVPSDERTPILPHPDGTYQMRVGVEVPTTEGDSYSCHVEHSSLGEDTLIVTWEPDNGLSMTVIIIIVCAVVVIVGALGGGIFIYTKKRRGYKTASTSDNNSDSSNNPKA
uniref:MHC class Ia alpha antigen n=1 Tax=Zhangixalus chenfui TaxID=3136582 RepID=A0A1W5YMT0_9NEOB|nr:MHC class Ia alpha antigen [Rhacophorus chenfui]